MFHSVVKLVGENDVASTVSNVNHLNVDIHNVDLTLFDVVNSKFEIHYVVATSI